jgi:selenocysteine-specific elongation factor
MHLDRAFSLHGIGTVVTGTLRRGSLSAGESVRILPSERTARIRGIHVHDRPVESAVAGQRVALNLVGVGREEVQRGDVVASPSSSAALSHRLDVLLDGELARPGERVQVHAGTRQAAARLVPIDGEIAQIRLEAPLVAEPGDRIVIRRIAPPDTLGGAVVLDPAPRRHGPGPAAERLRAAVEAEPEGLLSAFLADGVPADPSRWAEAGALGYAATRFSRERLQAAIEELVRSGAATVCDGILVPAGRAEAAASAPETAPLDATAVRVLRALDEDGLQPRGAAALAADLGIAREEVDAALAALAGAGRVVSLRGGVAYPSGRLDRIAELVAALAAERGSIGLAELRDALRISRKYSQAILEHLDSTGVTVRHGDSHVLRRPNEAARGLSG